MEPVGGHQFWIEVVFRGQIGQVGAGSGIGGQLRLKGAALSGKCPSQRVWQKRKMLERRNARKIDMSWPVKGSDARQQLVLQVKPDRWPDKPGDVVDTKCGDDDVAGGR